MSLRPRINQALLGAMVGPTGVALRHRAMNLAHRVRGTDRRVRFFFSFDDPYAYLLAWRVQEIPERYDIGVDWLPVPPAEDEDDAYDQRVRYAIADCAREARHARLPFKRSAPLSHASASAALAASEAARAQDEGRGVSFMVTLLTAIWGKGADPAAPGILTQVAEQAGLDPAPCVEATQRDDHWRAATANAALRDGLGIGHWGTALLELDTEFFMNHDRYDYLLERLDGLGLRRGAS